MKITTPRFTLGLIAAAVFTLTACGGGGGTTTAEAPAVKTASVTTTVMDGLIQNALVCIDTNSNGACETTETQGRTDATGKVTLSIATADLASAKLVAVIGLDATDADTGLVKTAYTLQTPAGRHAVISPLTSLVQAKIDADKAKGIVTSVETAETYVKTQTSLTVSVFDNFIAKRDTDAAYKKAGEVARVMVVSLQKSIEESRQTSTGTCTATGLVSIKRTESENDEGENHAEESRITSSLVDKLGDISKVSDDIAKLACASGNSVKDCDSEIKTRAPVVSSCTAAPVVTAPVVTPPVVTTPVVTPPVVTTPVVTTPVVTAPIVTTPVVTTPVVTTPVVTTSAATGKVVYMASCASCHSIMPVLNVSKVLKGANSASTILNAINSNAGGMGILKGTLSTQQLDDIAAYLVTPTL